MTYNVPGVYVTKRQTFSQPGLDTRCLAGFVGITERGEINKPVHIRSVDEYRLHFGGNHTDGILPDAVSSFFSNGGEECIVIRVADEEAAKKSAYTIEAQNAEVKFEAKTPGAWANSMKISLWRENDENFSVTLTCFDKTENYIHLSYNQSSERYFEKYINEHSSFVNVSSSGKAESFEPILISSFVGGNDGTDTLTAKHFIGTSDGPDKYTGLRSFEHFEEVALIAAPDVVNLKSLEDTFIVQSVMVEQAESSYNRFAILDTPDTFSVADACEWARAFDSSYAALYYPNISVQQPASMGGGQKSIPASGAVCGTIAKYDRQKGVFFPPAGVLLNQVSGFSKQLTLPEQEMLYESKVNFFRDFKGKGTKIWNARTLSSDANWRDISVRRTFNSVCRYLRRETAWAVFETNNNTLRKKIVRFVTAFLLDIWSKGYLAGTTQEEAFYVRCDEELNPPENIDIGLLTFEIGIAIVRPAEFFHISFSANQDGSSIYFDTDG